MMEEGGGMQCNKGPEPDSNLGHCHYMFIVELQQLVD